MTDKQRLLEINDLTTDLETALEKAKTVCDTLNEIVDGQSEDPLKLLEARNKAKVFNDIINDQLLRLMETTEEIERVSTLDNYQE